MSTTIMKGLFETIGLSVDDRYRLLDTDMGNIIHFNGRCLKFDFINTPNINRDEMLFDPIENPRMALAIFQYFADKYCTMTGHYIIGFCSIAGKNNTSALVLKIDNDELTTAYYKNESFKYLEMIFTLADEPTYIAELKNLDK